MRLACHLAQFMPTVPSLSLLVSGLSNSCVRPVVCTILLVQREQRHPAAIAGEFDIRESMKYAEIACLKTWPGIA